MISFVLFSLAGSALAGISGPELGGHNHFMGEQTFLLKRGHGGGIPSFGGGGLPSAPVFFKGNHGPIPQGPPILIKGPGGPPMHHGPPIFFKEAHKGGFGGHQSLNEEPTLIIKGNFDMPHGGHGVGGGFGGHGPLLQGPPIILKNSGHEGGHPMVHGPPIIIRGGFNGGFGHGGGLPILKGGGHTVQGPTILLKGGHGHGLKSGGPIILKGGFGGSAGGGAIGFGHEQHAVAGPSYLITTIHHVQKVSGGGKLIASFGGGGGGHAKSIGSFNFGHGGHVINKGW